MRESYAKVPSRISTRTVLEKPISTFEGGVFFFVQKMLEGSGEDVRTG